MKILTIQPNAEAFKLPYPYHVDQKGNVMHQDFWKGNPKQLIGFAPKGKQDIKVLLSDVMENGVEVFKVAGDVEPVFADSTDTWYSQPSSTGFTFRITEREETT